MKNLNAFLNTTPRVLKPILFKISENNRTLFYLKKQLPDFISSHCNQCIIERGLLTIFVDSPVWVSRLRFYTPDLLKKTGQQLPHSIESIKIRVLNRPRLIRPKAIDSKKVPSSTVIELLQESAKHSREGDLKQSLQRLSRTLKSLS